MNTSILQTTSQLSAHLRSLRKSHGLTQVQLGAMLGVDQTRIAKIERNPGAISVDQLLQIISALDAQLLLQPRAKARGTRAQRQNADW